MQKRLARFVLSALLIASTQMAAAQDHPQNHPLGRPVAIDKLPTGSLYVLDAKGAVHAVDFIGGKPVVTGSFQFPKARTAADIVSGQLNGQNVLFVAANLGMIGEISLYTVTGTLKSSWSLPNGVSSLAFDPAHSILYATSGHTPEIYRVDVARGGAPESIVRTPGSQRLQNKCAERDANSESRTDLVSDRAG